MKLKKLYEYYMLYKYKDMLNKSLIQEYVELYNVYAKNENVQAVMLGSSHGAYGIDTSVIKENLNENKIINLCSSSLDLYGTFEMTKNVINKYPKLKHIYITYSLFSNGYQLDKVEAERDKSILNKILFDIPIKNSILNENTFYQKLIENYILFKEKECKYEFRTKLGNKTTKREYFEFLYTVESRVAGHIKHNKRNSSENRYIEEIDNLCKKNNIKLDIVIMPVRNDYRRESHKYGETEELFSDIIEICKKREIALKSYYDYELEDIYFGDYDHLTEIGAKIFSEKLFQEIKV